MGYRVEESRSVGRLLEVQTDSATVEANLSIPEGAQSIVLFAHGTGSSRHSSRNRFVAEALNEGGLATLLIDLLTPDEKRRDLMTREVRFDIDRLGKRVTGAVDWLAENEETRDLKIGCFGSSTGAASALIAAANRPDLIKAVVSRGGRVDMAKDVLEAVEAPTLCIVGGRDVQVLAVSRWALQRMDVEKGLEIVADAGHLFEEPGALEEVARLTREWFQDHLG
ncbi:MAG: dienelactone hydrolase family protein [Anaerolineales bacterium]